jgi:hypothetical protein
METLRRNERQDETQFTTKIDGFSDATDIRFCWFILNLTLFYDQTQGSDAVFSILYTDNAIYRPTLEMTGLVISSFNMSVRRWISR